MEDKFKEWSEWSIYVLKELERLNRCYESLDDKMDTSILKTTEITGDLNRIKRNEEKIKQHDEDINDLKKFKIQILAIWGFTIGAFIFIAKVWPWLTTLGI